MNVLRFLCVALATTLLTGCASYEFQVLQPHVSQRIVPGAGVALDMKPLRYRLRTAAGRLVLDIINPAPASIELLGSKSVVVSPDGQSHPLIDQTIAPHSYIREILPPYAPQVQGPPVVFAGDNPAIYPFDEPGYILPPGYNTAEIDTRSPLYWNWNGQADVHLTLVYQRGDQIFSQTFTFARIKR